MNAHTPTPDAMQPDTQPLTARLRCVAKFLVDCGDDLAAPELNVAYKILHEAADEIETYRHYLRRIESGDFEGGGHAKQIARAALAKAGE